jgi:glycosyltransferase involved in cell wall biosynthesis
MIGGKWPLKHSKSTMLSHKYKNPKVALVYDRVNTSYGGAEHLVKAIGEIFPKAPLFTSVYSKNKSKWANNFKIIPSFLQKIKFLRNHHQFIATLMPFAFESLDLSNFNIIISVTSAEAKGVLTKPNQLHICYMLTPTRYLYSHKESYLKSQKIFKCIIIKSLAKLGLNYIRWWDKAAANRPDVIIPISNLVKSRIKKYYNLSSAETIYPPVNTSLRVNKSQKKIDPYYLSLSRLVSYKKVNLSIQAAIELNKTLVVVGTGAQEKNLKKLSKGHKNIIFTGNISEDRVNYLLANCKALIMPGEEDFGITGLEASILGKPVIVFYKSGVAELLKNGIDSVFIKKETKKEIVKAIKKLETINFDTKLIKSRAKKHNTEKFKKEFEQKILKSWKEFTERTLCHT